MKPVDFIRNNIESELVAKGVSEEDAKILADDSVMHWKKVSHCKGGMFQYLLNRAIKRSDKGEDNEK